MSLALEVNIECRTENDTHLPNDPALDLAHRSGDEQRLLLFLLTTIIALFLSLGSLHLLSPDTAWTTSAKR